MRKFRFLFILLILSLLIVPPVLAQETVEEEVDVVADLLMPNLEAYFTELPDHYGTLSVDAFVELLAENPDVVILDVREDAEVEADGIIEGSIHVPLRELGANLDLLPDLEAMIVVVCKSGFRATIGMTALHVLGYENTKVLVGGFGAWVGQDLPVVATPAEVEAAAVPEDIDPLLVEYVADYLANLPEGWGAVRPDVLFEETFDAMPDLLLDVRSDAEWAEPGYILGATHIWVDNLYDNLDAMPEDLDANIVVYCASGYRGGVTATVLGLLGYTNVRNLAGGVNGWVAADLPLETD